MKLFGKKKAAATAGDGKVDQSGLDGAFDDLIRRARDGEQGAVEAFWDMFMQLDQVYMVARGSMPNPTPFIANIDNRVMLALFTSEKKAIDFSVKQGTSFDETEAHATLSQSVFDIISYCSRLFADGVECIVVNDGGDGSLFAPISNLVGMFEKTKGDLPLIVFPAGQGEFDHRTKLMFEAQGERERLKASQSLWARYFLIPQWHLMTNEGDGSVLMLPTQQGGERAAICSDIWNSELASEGLGRMFNIPVATTLIPTPKLIETLRSFGDDDMPVLINPAGVANLVTIGGMSEIWDDMPSMRDAHGIT